MYSKLSLVATALGILAATAGFAQGNQAGKCIVSGQALTVTDKTPSVAVNQERAFFCCDNCPKAFADNPEKFVKNAGNCPVNKSGAAKVSKETRVVLNNGVYYMCCGNCVKAVAENPANAAKELRDPVSGKAFAPTASSPRVMVDKQIYLFANAETKAEFEKNRGKYVRAYK